LIDARWAYGGAIVGRRADTVHLGKNAAAWGANGVCAKHVVLPDEPAPHSGSGLPRRLARTSEAMSRSGTTPRSVTGE
jgi:hypothetical protein